MIYISQIIMYTFNVYGAVCQLHLDKTERKKIFLSSKEASRKGMECFCIQLEQTLQPEQYTKLTKTLPSETEHLVYLDFLLPWPTDGQQSPAPRPPGTTGSSFLGKHTHSQQPFLPTELEEFCGGGQRVSLLLKKWLRARGEQLCHL